jgi:hypothetical protein
MAGKARDFVKQVHDQEGYWLNYPPGQAIKLGDIVERQAGVWIPIGNVGDRGVEFATTGEGSEKTPSWTSQSKKGVEVKSSLDLEPGALKFLADGELGARVSFEGGSKYLLSLSDVTFDRVKSIEDFWNAVKQKYSTWTWDLGHRVVTSVARAESGSFLGSGDSSATYELKAKAKVKVETVNVADLAVGFKLVSTSSSSSQFVGLGNLTPLFRLHRVTLILGNLTPAAVEMGDDHPRVASTGLIEDDTDPDSDE